MHVLAPAAIAAAAMLFSPIGRAQDAGSIADAKAAAESWLAASDSGSPAAAWDQAARIFKSNVSKTAWTSAFYAARSPLGALKSRQLRSALYTRSVPGAPPGEYVVIQYDSQFENKANAVETVTPMREPDGSWRVSGYFIR